MQINLYKNFNKKINSTALPSSNYDVIECTLKQDTSIYNPTFIFNNSWGGDFPSWTYVRWANRYYYINDKIWGKGLNNLEIVCAYDYMGSNKSNIYNSTGFIELAPKQDTISIKNDSRIATSETVEQKKISSVDLLDTTKNNNSYHYVLNFINLTGEITPPSVTYTDNAFLRSNVIGLRLSDVTIIMKSLTASDYIEGIGKWTATKYSDTSETIEYTGGNVVSSAKDSVLALYYTPFNLQGSTNSGSIHLSNYQIRDVHGIALLRTFTATRFMALHDDSQYNYKNTPTYSSYDLFINAYGMIHLDSLLCLNNPYLGLRTTVDQATGDVITLVYYCKSNEAITDTSILAGQYSYNIFSEIQISKTSGQKGVGGILNGIKQGLKSLNKAYTTAVDKAVAETTTQRINIDTPTPSFTISSNLESVDVGSVGTYTGLAKFVNMTSGASIDQNITATLYQTINTPVMDQTEINNYWNNYGQVYNKMGTVKDLISNDSSIKSYFRITNMNVTTESPIITNQIKETCANGFYYE